MDTSDTAGNREHPGRYAGAAWPYPQRAAAQRAPPWIFNDTHKPYPVGRDHFGAYTNGVGRPADIGNPHLHDFRVRARLRRYSSTAPFKSFMTGAPR